MDVKIAFSADLMSGICQTQKSYSCRPYEISPEETVGLAKKLNIPIPSTKYILFETSKRLYINGMVGCVKKLELDN